MEFVSALHPGRSDAEIFDEHGLLTNRTVRPHIPITRQHIDTSTHRHAEKHRRVCARNKKTNGV
eukprot:2839746-Pyramimonas_sp.AAC.1